MKKICVVTGSRAEYGLYCPLLKKITANPAFTLQLLVTGMHLSPRFGSTYREIEKDGFTINAKVPMLSPSQTDAGVTESISRGIIGCGNVFRKFRPDRVIVLGDRFEIFAAAIAAFIARIPIMHLYGGELTEGALDDAMRHAITKMSMVHCVSTEIYRRRVIQLGESPRRVFTVGALGIDVIRSTKLLQKDALERELKFKFGFRNALVTFHPATIEDNTAGKQFDALAKALDAYDDLKIIFTKTNADAGGNAISRHMEAYVKKNRKKVAFFISLGAQKYLSTIRHVDIVIGNSSSGIVETPSFGKPSVNIGDRQKGRIHAESVINCEPKKDAIKAAMDKAFSEDFRKLCRAVKNPYDSGDAAGKIVQILKNTMGSFGSLKKEFYDLPAAQTGKV